MVAACEQSRWERAHKLTYSFVSLVCSFRPFVFLEMVYFVKNKQTNNPPPEMHDELLDSYCYSYVIFYFVLFLNETKTVSVITTN